VLNSEYTIQLKLFISDSDNSFNLTTQNMSEILLIL